MNVIYDLAWADTPFLLDLKNAHAKETSWLDEAAIGALLKIAFYARGIDGGATALLLALDQDAPYRNPNFDRFRASRETFVYIDRVVVAGSARGRGIARLL